MKSIKLFLMAVVAMSLASCGSKSANTESNTESVQEEQKPISVEPKDTAVTGSMAGLFKVTDKKYKIPVFKVPADKIIYRENEVYFPVELERLDTEFPDFFYWNDYYRKYPEDRGNRPKELRTMTSFGRTYTVGGTTVDEAFIHVGFGIEFFDADDNLVHKIAASDQPEEDCGCDYVDMMRTQPGQKGMIRFKVYRPDVETAVSFRVTCDAQEIK